VAVGGAGQVEDDFPKKYNVCHCIRYKWATAGRRLEGIFILHTQTPGSSYQSAEENRKLGGRGIREEKTHQTIIFHRCGAR